MNNKGIKSALSIFLASVISMISVPYQIPADTVSAIDNNWNMVYYNQIIARRGEAEFFDLYDINADGIPELFLSSPGTKGTITVEIFTYAHGKLWDVAMLFPNVLYAAPESDTLVCCTSYMGFGTDYGANTTEYFCLYGAALQKTLWFGNELQSGVVVGYNAFDEPVSEDEYNAIAADWDPVINGYEQIGQRYELNTLNSQVWNAAVQNAERPVENRVPEEWKYAYIALLNGAEISGAYETYTLTEQQRTHYELADLDLNGIPELFTANREPEYASFDQPLIFTFSRGELKEIEMDASNFTYGWNSIYSGSVCVNTDAGYVTDTGHNVFYKFDGNTLKLEAVFRHTSDGYHYNDQLVTQQEYEKQYQKYADIADQSEQFSYFNELTDFSMVYSYESFDLFDYQQIPGGIRINGFVRENIGQDLTYLTFPDTVDDQPVTEIGAGAFSRLIFVTDVFLPEGLKVIGEGAFSDILDLQEITLPASLTEIGNGAFSMNFSFEAFHLEEGNEQFVEQDGVLYSPDMKTLLRFPSGKVNKDYVFPESVTKIGEYAFSGSKGINDITIPEQITEIGMQAFISCMNMEHIRIMNPDCVIADDGSGYTISTLKAMPYVGTVYGYTGSTAEAFANKYHYKFQSLGGSSVTTELTTSETTITTFTTTTVTSAETTVSITEPVPEIGKLVISPVVASVGDTVAVPIRLTENPGIVALSLALSFDPDDLELLDVQNGSVLTPAVFLSGNDLSEQPYILNWDYDEEKNLTGTGEIATLYFHIKNTAAKKTAITVSVNQYSTFDYQLQEVPFQVSGGMIYTAILGDINCDDTVSVADAVLLCRYLAEDAPEPFRDDIIYDIDADGLLTIMDVAALLGNLIP